MSTAYQPLCEARDELRVSWYRCPIAPARLRVTLLFHATVLVVGVASGLWVLPLLLSLFPFIGNWGGYFVGLTQHCGLLDNGPDTLESSIGELAPNTLA